MEYIKPLQSIYSLYERIKTNDQQCPHVLERLKALEKLSLFILQKESEQISDDLNEALGKLNKVLLSADELIRKFTEAFELTRAMKSNDYKSEFETLNKSLTDAFVTLSAALHAHQRKMLDKQETRLSEQENMLSEQKVMLKWQKKKMAETGRKLAEQDRKLAEQDRKMAEQDRKFAEQERKLGKQEEMLQKVETKLACESRGNCRIL
ncbi:Mixed lineage kinase domain-like protein [Dissostichus eleginoides]|uniref:Mixed lineage kinase domain-like protein n=1 Tax=Dissostichus eleginoides TaxID=100907 RepID=A0AAD9BQG1_DISEL|nr:Mixed lineage kinase domain-like protein [Dissostichus eleginoides]